MSEEEPKASPDASGPYRSEASPEAQQLDCKTFLKAWSAGTRIPSVVAHFDSCEYCKAVRDEGVDMDAAAWRRQQSARKRTHSRRRFVAYGIGAAAVLVGGLTLGFNFDSGGAHRGGNGAIGIPTKKLFGEDMHGWELVYRTRGRAVVAAQARSGSTQDAANIYDWIIESRKAALYDIIVEGVGDPRNQAKNAAIRCLRKMPKRNAVDFVTQLEKIINNEPNPAYKTAIQKIVDAIQVGP